MAVLTVEHVQAQYPGAEQPVLKDVSFQLGSEQLMVALGASGSGKTTLLNCWIYSATSRHFKTGW